MDMFEMVGIDLPKEKKKKINRRQFDFDFIYTDSSSKGLCCMAIQAGLRYGIQSGFNACPRHKDFSGRHRLLFIDNNYKNYNHQKHLESVKKYKPKYCTTKDLMTEEQCEQAKIPYFSFDEIMEQAYELKEHAENVILIPKYDCLKDIDKDDFMLGYSVPTSHGGTELDIELFSSWKVHLLGGSWKDQLEKIEKYDFIVSADNNYFNKVAIYGRFTYPNGDEGNLLKDFGLEPTNHWHVAVVLSCGNIAAKLNEIFGDNNA